MIIKKPWGYEEVIEINKKFMFKKLFMKKGHQCSLPVLWPQPDRPP